ncbi:MAG: ATP-dependent sacrificial sulfur transferase LarE [Bacteroidales bacterium]|nr:ATP-dependent sacrificial sulfur transferase LarE [Bacteroidales bacterium]
MKTENESSEYVHRKLERLKSGMSGLESLAVAFSGGVDSTFLLYVAHQVLGEKVLALTALSAFYPDRESNEAISFAQKHGIRQITCTVDELGIKGFAQNPLHRCYLCKRHLFGVFNSAIAQEGIRHLAEGSNADDVGDYRPGMKAVKELQVLSPLREAGLTKDEIRLLSKEMGLPTWNKPSFACLASRIPYGESITREKLEAVAAAEQLLMDLGFGQARVRHHGKLARIEISPDELEKLVTSEIRNKVTTAIKKRGFAYVTVDLQGYRTGSMNETIPH